METNSTNSANITDNTALAVAVPASKPKFETLKILRPNYDIVEFQAARESVGGFSTAITARLLNQEIRMSPDGKFLIRNARGVVVTLRDAAMTEAHARREFEQAQAQNGCRVTAVDPQAAWLALPRETRLFFAAAARSTDETERALFIKIGRVFKSAAGAGVATAEILALFPELSR